MRKPYKLDENKFAVKHLYKPYKLDENKFAVFQAFLFCFVFFFKFLLQSFMYLRVSR